MPKDIKLSKAQLFKIIRLGGFTGTLLNQFLWLKMFWQHYHLWHQLL